MSSEPDMVTGSACLDYINRPIGFGDHGQDAQQAVVGLPNDANCNLKLVGNNTGKAIGYVDYLLIPTCLRQWNHNTSARKCALVTGESPDGGLQVAILGTEQFRDTGNLYGNAMRIDGLFKYEDSAVPLSVLKTSASYAKK